jgi:hypothetical protein
MKNKDLFVIALATLMFSCATIVPPTGGPNDTTPPKILSIVPKDKTIRFTAKTINITFDEYVDLKEPDQRIALFPSAETPIKTKIKGKEIEIDLPENLEKNTTYKLVMDGCFVDIHEGNAIEKTEYLFSTGNQIDTATLSGVVFDGRSLEKEKGLTCVLTKTKEDFEKGKYCAKEISSENGTFSFTALDPNKSFFLFAFKDENKDGRWGTEEKIAILKKQVRAKSTWLLYSFDPSPDQKILTVKNEKEGIIEIAFKKEPMGAKINCTYLDQKMVIAKKEKEKIFLYYGPTKIVKEKLVIEAKELVPEEREIALLQKETRENTPVKQNREEKTGFDTDKGIELGWQYPLEKITPEKIFLFADTVRQIPFDYRIKKTQLIITAEWEAKKQYKLELKDSATQNIYGVYSQASKAIYFATQPKDKGNITLNVINLNPKKQYLFHVKQMHTEKPIKKAINETTTKIEIKDKTPGEFTVLMVIDENKNGQWDKGDYAQDREPEKVYAIATIKLEEKLDVEQTIDAFRIKTR